MNPCGQGARVVYITPSTEDHDSFRPRVHDHEISLSPYAFGRAVSEDVHVEGKGGAFADMLLTRIRAEVGVAEFRSGIISPEIKRKRRVVFRAYQFSRLTCMFDVISGWVKNFDFKAECFGLDFCVCVLLVKLDSRSVQVYPNSTFSPPV